jgi:nicotinamidase-related amidase
MALLVIDVQKGLFEKSTPIYNADGLLANINLLIDRAHQERIPVFFIQHSSDKVLPLGSDEWRLHPRLQILPAEPVIGKTHPNAFEETTLKAELDARHVGRLVVTGLVTHGCVKATCLGAHDLGYKVTLVKDGHSSYSKQARELIDEWNDRLSRGVVELEAAADVRFK